MLIIPIKEGENIDRALKRYKRKFDKQKRSSIKHVPFYFAIQKIRIKVQSSFIQNMR
jgi:small subunit ribosomal protein S21